MQKQFIVFHYRVILMFEKNLMQEPWCRAKSQYQICFCLFADAYTIYTNSVKTAISLPIWARVTKFMIMRL